eukprot:CAMPEP_0182428864 /NCGR_PEP_ID=MMETSP1167-20130531/24302_1 /TAXON_ID=2988 /ORGANISM="Mallomonas Sp, Strain CCMP3275" /LENGTH=422 /DNA_ID=CAMNT_0024612045 /DNA_START=246 /DNA_END=1515 /DNA_ORIENTATION=+
MKLLMETGSGDLLHSHATNGNTSADAADIHQQIAIQVACFLHRELPIRLAHRAVELESIPIMCQSKHVMQVANWYKESFRELRETEAPTDAIKEAKFAHIVQSIFHRHSNTLLTMAKGAHEIRQILKQDVYEFAEYTEIQNSLEWFYMSRIGIRMLICQYLALKSPPNEPDMIGLISTRASPLMIANDAIRDTTYVCTRTHGEAPEVQIHGRTDLTFPYVSSHLHYMLVELLKNSMRATVEHAERKGWTSLPPIKIVIADGEENEDVAIKVSDEGGGIPRSHIKRMWSYLFTTANSNVLDDILGDSSDFDTSTPLAGLGYGLPISRNYARYFGGDIVIMSMEGYGTDSFIYLPRLADIGLNDGKDVENNQSKKEETDSERCKKIVPDMNMDMKLAHESTDIYRAIKRKWRLCGDGTVPVMEN